MIEISRQAARRYLLARQGLWPRRRWAGKEGAAQAIHALEAVQIDPMTVVARSHDLVLWSRVEGYQPAHLDELLYRDRRFFDYGGHLDIYPMAELPFWTPHMRRRAGTWSEFNAQDAERWAAWRAQSADLLERVRALVRERGPVANRDLDGARATAWNYRSGKETGVALYQLWLAGELMTSGRRGWDRLFDLRERVAPPVCRREATEAEARAHFGGKTLRYFGLATARMWTARMRYYLGAPVERRYLDEMVERGEAAPMTIEGVREPYYTPAAGGELEAADVGESADPPEEVNLLSPLDNLLARARTKTLFDFAYLWEVYKKPAQRQYGRYTMPVLYGDALVARLEPRLDRKAGVLAVDGFWPEAPAPVDDPAFAAALGRGLQRFAAFHGARLDATGLPAKLRGAARLHAPDGR